MSREVLVRLQNLSKHYDGAAAPVLCDVDLEVRSGEFLVLLGRSGSGKSTLLNLIAGLDVPSGGEVIVNGRSLSGETERARTLFRRRHMGFVFQTFSLLPTLSVIENVLLPLELNAMPRARMRERALAMLEQLGLSAHAERFPETLSGGEQQRVAIARALVHNPLLVLADEPTGNLDLETGRQVIALLDSLTRQAGKTLIMATHSREVIGLCDRLLTLNDGRLAEIAGAES